MTYNYLWPRVAAFLYVCGAYLHYIHVLSVFHLLDKEDEIDRTKAVTNSLVWPVTALEFMIHTLTGSEDE